jgi:hypothetical protein
MVPVSMLPDRRDRQVLPVALVVRVSIPPAYRDRQYADRGGGCRPGRAELLPFTGASFKPPAPGHLPRTADNTTHEIA